MCLPIKNNGNLVKAIYSSQSSIFRFQTGEGSYQGYQSVLKIAGKSLKVLYGTSLLIEEIWLDLEEAAIDLAAKHLK